MSDTLNGMRHCDEFIDDYEAPNCLRWFLLINRLPAIEKMLAAEMGVNPKLFADVIKPNNQGRTQRVRVVMASRFGDVGISINLHREHGYSKRVAVEELTNFRNTLEHD